MDVIKYFEEINKIPRGSGNEKAVSDYIAGFARERGLEVLQDNFNNLMIFKPQVSSKNTLPPRPPVILQAHLDMVCEKNAGTSHDFTREPIKMYTEGDFIKARGTTLGADNGIGVAMCMALLDSNEIEHPPLEIVLTTNEETGMDGAENLDMSKLKGKRMVNLDSSDETTFTMGCAAGTTAEFILPVKREKTADFLSDLDACEISVTGLKGGHSGGDIEKERGNALRILAFLLEELRPEIYVAEISGGMKINAIPREAFAKILLPRTAVNEAEKILKNCRKNFEEQYRASDSGIQIDWKFLSKEKKETGAVLSRESTGKVISALLLLPTGMVAQSLEIDGLVNASCNIGVVETTENHVKISSMARGATVFFTRQTEAQISALARHMGAQAIFSQRSPAWPYNPKSVLLEAAKKAYKNVFGGEAKTTALHGGLECGVFSAKIPGIDIISYGPNSYDYHTPDEKVSISSTNNVWKFLCELLKTI
ncbi:MAG: aminoacyl-histidine dipeptidase [Defluviitaleaceae bacterium]|nr:aminoacyl-histidine dipeptidase [Defluviitaleaceae bacterium]